MSQDSQKSELEILSESVRKVHGKTAPTQAGTTEIIWEDGKGKEIKQTKWPSLSRESFMAISDAFASAFNQGSVDIMKFLPALIMNIHLEDEGAANYMYVDALTDDGALRDNLITLIGNEELSDRNIDVDIPENNEARIQLGAAEKESDKDDTTIDASEVMKSARATAGVAMLILRLAIKPAESVAPTLQKSIETITTLIGTPSKCNKMPSPKSLEKWANMLRDSSVYTSAMFYYIADRALRTTQNSTMDGVAEFAIGNRIRFHGLALISMTFDVSTKLTKGNIDDLFYRISCTGNIESVQRVSDAIDIHGTDKGHWWYCRSYNPAYHLKLRVSDNLLYAYTLAYTLYKMCGQTTATNQKVFEKIPDDQKKACKVGVDRWSVQVSQTLMKSTIKNSIFYGESSSTSTKPAPTATTTTQPQPSPQAPARHGAPTTETKPAAPELSRTIADMLKKAKDMKQK